MELINQDLDLKQNSIKTIESFTDRYIPVKIIYLMRQSFAAVMSRTQMLKYENWEREKLHTIHDELVKEETNADINATIKKILNDINEVILQY